MGTTWTVVRKNVIESPHFIIATFTKSEIKSNFQFNCLNPVTIFPTCIHLLGLWHSLQTLYQTAVMSGFQSSSSSIIYHGWKQSLCRKQDQIMYLISWTQDRSEWQFMGNFYSGVFLESWFSVPKLWQTGEACMSWDRFNQGVSSWMEWSIKKTRFVLGRRKMNCWAESGKTCSWAVLYHLQYSWGNGQH